MVYGINISQAESFVLKLLIDTPPCLPGKVGVLGELGAGEGGFATAE